MKLRNPGPIRPAPALLGAAGQLANTIENWRGVASFTHWQYGSTKIEDGAEYHVGDFELGHIHPNGDVHIILNDELTAFLVRQHLADTLVYSDAWISYPVRSSGDLPQAAWLFDLAYRRIKGTSDQAILERITNRSGL